MPVKIFLVEGREIIRQGISAMLNHQRNIKLVGEASDTGEALEKLRNQTADVILLDMSMPVPAIIAFTKKVKEKYPAIRILVLTMYEYESSLTRILQGGVDGYLLKDTNREAFIIAIEQLTAEGILPNNPLSPEPLVKNKIVAENVVIPVLTEREAQVLELIAQGLTNTQMAQKLFTSVRTIETRRKNLLQKTGTVNTATLIRFAVLNGLIK